jgi:hypothetical protein
MSIPVFAQARDSINKAYVALQNWNTNPTDIPLPDIVDTKRTHLTGKQIAARYQKSIEGNLEIDINKIPKMKPRDRTDHEPLIVDVAFDSTKGTDHNPDLDFNINQKPMPNADQAPTLTLRRQIRLDNCAEGGGGGDGKRAAEVKMKRDSTSSDSSKWKTATACSPFGASSFGDNILNKFCWAIESDNFKRRNEITMNPVLQTLRTDSELCLSYGAYPLFIEDAMFDVSMKLATKVSAPLIQPGVTHVLARPEFCAKAKELGAKDCKILKLGHEVKQIDDFLKMNRNGLYFDSIIVADFPLIDTWAAQSNFEKELGITAVTIRTDPGIWGLLKILTPILGISLLGLNAGLLACRFRNNISEGYNRLKSTCCKPSDDEDSEVEIEEGKVSASANEESPSVVVDDDGQYNSDFDNSSASSSHYLGSSAGNIDGGDTKEEASNEQATGEGPTDSESSS